MCLNVFLKRTVLHFVITLCIDCHIFIFSFISSYQGQVALFWYFIIIHSQNYEIIWPMNINLCWWLYLTTSGHMCLFKSRYFIIIYFPFLLYLMLKPRIIRLVTFISEHMMLEKAGLSIIFWYFVFMLMYYQILEYTWRWNFTSFILFNESFISKCFKRDII